MNTFECKPLENFIERHRARGTLRKLFLGGWALVLALAILLDSHEDHIVETLLCWGVVALFTVLGVGVLLDLGLTLLWRHFKYFVGCDRQVMSILWRGGKGNIGFPRKALKRVAFRIQPKTKEFFIGVSLKSEMLAPNNPEADKFFKRFRDRYGCEYALTDRQIGNRKRILELVDFLRLSGRVKVENREKIVEIPPAKFNLAYYIGAALMYAACIYYIIYLGSAGAATAAAAVGVS